LRVTNRRLLAAAVSQDAQPVVLDLVSQGRRRLLRRAGQAGLKAGLGLAGAEAVPDLTRY